MGRGCCRHVFQVIYQSKNQINQSSINQFIIALTITITINIYIDPDLSASHIDIGLDEAASLIVFLLFLN